MYSYGHLPDWQGLNIQVLMSLYCAALTVKIMVVGRGDCGFLILPWVSCLSMVGRPGCRLHGRSPMFGQVCAFVYFLTAYMINRTLHCLRAEPLLQHSNTYVANCLWLGLSSRQYGWR